MKSAAKLLQLRGAQALVGIHADCDAPGHVESGLTVTITGDGTHLINA